MLRAATGSRWEDSDNEPGRAQALMCARGALGSLSGRAPVTCVSVNVGRRATIVMWWLGSAGKGGKQGVEEIKPQEAAVKVTVSRHSLTTALPIYSPFRPHWRIHPEEDATPGVYNFPPPHSLRPRAWGSAAVVVVGVKYAGKH